MQLDSFYAQATAQGFNFTPNFDGKIQRFNIGFGENLRGWAYSHKIVTPKKEILFVKYGDWATGSTFDWRSDTEAQYTEEELAAINAELAAQQAKVKKEAEEGQAKARELATKLYLENRQNSPFSPLAGYLHKKGFANYEKELSSTSFLSPPYLSQDQQNLVIPVFDTRANLFEGKPCSLQSINGQGFKKFLPSGKLKGCFHYIHGHGAEELYIAEGYATGLTLRLVTGAPVLVAFNAGNLVNLARGLDGSSGLAPLIHGHTLVFAADRDESGIGEAKAREAAEYLEKLGHKVQVKLPPPMATGGSDWNDFWMEEGAERTLAALSQTPATTPATTPEPTRLDPPAGSASIGSLPAPQPTKNSTKVVRGMDILSQIKLDPPAWRIPLGKKLPAPPPQDEIACALADAYSSHLIREGEEVFIWTGTHWEETLPKNFKRFIRTRAQFLMRGEAKDRELDAYYNIFLDKLATPPPGVSLYQQPPYLSNFIDGTLEVKASITHGPSLQFRPHRKTDYLTWVLPYEYTKPREENKLLSNWIDLCFGSDPDKEGKVRALKQIGGAALVSLFPRTAFLFGPAGTGKSTFAKLCAKFAGPDNVASVEPYLMRQDSFLMEGLINKQINIVTDISEKKHMDSVVFKKIEDRVRFQINRKNRVAILANIPAVHIFCCNSLPKGIEGGSSALDRRVTIVRFEKDVGPGTGVYTRDYENEILAAGPEGVLAFFLEGLEDLMRSGGVYFNPETGKEILSDWKKENDLIELFLQSVKEGDYAECKLGAERSIKARDLWDLFLKFCNSNRGMMQIPGRNQFYIRASNWPGVVRRKHRTDFIYYHGVGSLGGALDGQGTDSVDY